MHSTFDSSRWSQRIATLTTSAGETIRINYIDCPAPKSSDSKGVILLIHGFPQTSYQFRHVITPLSNAGYRVIAPDYRGAGQSSKPKGGYEKSQMAEDLHLLIHEHLGIKQRIHVVGHDIGGMIALPYAMLYANDVASVVWGECPLLGSNFYEENKGIPAAFHFVFHQIPDLPEALIAGREKIYIKHFFEKQSYNSGAISAEDLEHYALAYSQPGAIRAGLEVYRAFERDAEENRQLVKKHGKCKVPTLNLNAAKFLLAQNAESMLADWVVSPEFVALEESGHYVAEEDPEGFVEAILKFVKRHAV